MMMPAEHHKEITSPSGPKKVILSDEMRETLMDRRQSLLLELQRIEDRLGVYHRCKFCKAEQERLKT